MTIGPMAATALLVLACTTARAQETRAARAEPHNPPALRASQPLGPDRAPPRVRFEWEQVAGAQSYLLVGEWMTRQSWAKQSRRVRVTPGNARAWTSAQVSIELELPAGAHSWTLVAVSGPDDLGDFAQPARLSFEVR